MLSSRKRLGWLALSVVLLGSLASYWFAGPAVSALQLSDADKANLAALAETDYSEWLTEFADKLNTDDSAKQVLLLQCVPNEQPLVIATTQESDGDEEPTHWRAPWPALTETLRTGKIEQPLVVHSRYQGFDYVHHLFPFEPTQTRCLLVNEIASAPSWSGFRLLTVILATLTAVALKVRD